MRKLLSIFVGFIALIAAIVLIGQPLITEAVAAFPYATGGTGTTSPSVGQIAWWSKGFLAGVATTTASCSGTASCSSFVVIGTSPVTITGGAAGAWPFTPSTNFGTAVQSTSTPIWDTAGFQASSTSHFVNLKTWGELFLPATTTSLLGTDSAGIVIATTSISSQLILVPANSVLSGNSSGVMTATTSIGVNFLTGILPVANGGTGAATLSGCLTGNGSAPFTASGVCNTSNATVSSITGGNGLNGGTITTSGTLSLKSYIGTSSAETSTYVPFWTSTAANPATLSGGNSGFTFTTGSTLLTITNASTTNVTAATSLQIPNSSNPQPKVSGYIAESTNAPYQLQYGNGTAAAVAIDPRPAFSIGISSTTAFVASTTAQNLVVPFAVTVTNVRCTMVPVGATATVEWYFTNLATPQSTPFYFVASSTPGLETITANNTPTAGATTTIIVGNTTGSPTETSCTFLATTTPA